MVAVEISIEVWGRRRGVSKDYIHGVVVGGLRSTVELASARPLGLCIIQDEEVQLDRFTFWGEKPLEER